ncbi:MAG: APC family permease [Candidatus Sumerlaeaceae bacterium]
MQLDNPHEPQLRRTLGLFAITAFGVGDILGSGVYALVGKISGHVGSAAWMSYLVAGFAAALTGLTYAEFTSRYPRAGGAAHFVQTVFRTPLVTFLVMCFVGLSGMFSMAATSRTFANYALAGTTGAHPILKDYLFPFAFLLIIALVAIYGIVLSSRANLVCTIVEIAGLFIIIALGIRFLGRVDYVEFAKSEQGTGPPLLVLQGAALAFFAFIGFEDMANLSEEVKNPERNVPWAICLAIVITSVIYVTIALIAVSVLPFSALGKTDSPLLDVVHTSRPGFPDWIYKIIPAFAVFNTALLNCLMASRLIYGMARGRNNVLPSFLGHVHPRWRTPAIAVGVATLITIIMMASTKQIAVLAAGTTVFLLTVFMVLHIGLIKTKLTRGGERPPFQVPIFVPILGAITCAVLLVTQKREALHTAKWLGVAILALFVVNWFFRGRRQIEAID